jgi:hypothetical protein
LDGFCLNELLTRHELCNFSKALNINLNIGQFKNDIRRLDERLADRLVKLKQVSSARNCIALLVIE